jgi:hypothetical protein
MSYSDPREYLYQDALETDFGAGTGTAWSFKGPSGKQGSLKNIGLHVTETFECDQTEGAVKIGTSSDDDYYGKLNITEATAATDTFNDQNDSNAVLVEALPADTQIEVTYVQCVDAGTAAGKGNAYVEVEWY